MPDNAVTMLVRGEYVIFNPAEDEDGTIADGAVAVGDDGSVISIGQYRDLVGEYPDVRVEGGPHCLVMPGMIDAHSHGMGMTYFELGPGYDHLEYWNTIIPTIARPDKYLDTLWCAVKHIKSGCTTINHMGGASSADQVMSAYDEAGIRRAFSLTVKDQNLLTYDDADFFETLPADLKKEAAGHYLPDRDELHEEYFERFHQIYERYHSPTSPVILGPMGPQWCTPELLEKIRQAAEEYGVRIHMHGVQTPYQNHAIMQAYGCSSIEHLRNLGLLGPGLTIGHGVWISERDIDMIAAAGVSLTHHPACNLNMRNGILPLAQLMEAGATVAVALDGKGINDDEDMIAEMRLAEKLHRVAKLNPGAPLTVTPERLVQMTTGCAARTLGLEEICGGLKPGMRADIAVVDLKANPWVNPNASPQERLVMQKSKYDVKTVIVDGEVIMRDGQVLTVDEENLLEELSENIARERSSEPGKPGDLLDRLRPYILNYYEDLEPIPDSIEPFYPVNRKIWK